MSCEWIDLDEPDPVGDTLRVEAAGKGAALFVRGEGLCWKDGALYVSCTTGGSMGRGQVFRYRPGKTPAVGGTIELIAQAGREQDFLNPDAMAMSPWGDLFLAEDTLGHCRIQMLDGEGRVHDFAGNALSTSEFAGLCFSPDGNALFCNIQEDGLTLVIRGPFRPGGDPGRGGATDSAGTGGSTGLGTGIVTDASTSTAEDTGSSVGPEPEPNPDGPGKVPPRPPGASAECACTTEGPGQTPGKALVAAVVAGTSRPRR